MWRGCGSDSLCGSLSVYLTSAATALWEDLFLLSVFHRSRSWQQLSLDSFLSKTEMFPLRHAHNFWTFICNFLLVESTTFQSAVSQNQTWVFKRLVLSDQLSTTQIYSDTIEDYIRNRIKKLKNAKRFLCVLCCPPGADGRMRRMERRRRLRHS